MAKQILPFARRNLATLRVAEDVGVEERDGAHGLRSQRVTAVRPDERSLKGGRTLHF